MGRTLRTLLIVSLALVLLGSLIAWTVQTQGGTITVRDVRFIGANGTPMSALLYIPPNATSETPAPGILAVHGYINSREVQSGYAIEYARRGYVVLSLDQTGHGYSGGAAFAKGFGGPDGLRYLRSLDIVDPDNIGLSGHSMGGWASLAAAATFPDDYKSVMLQGSSTGAPFAMEGSPEWPRNLGLVFSEYDEFSQLMWASAVPGNAPQGEKMMSVFGTTEPVQPGQLYGSIEQGTARWFQQPPVTHAADHLSATAIGHAIDWMQQTLEGGSPLPVTDQVWRVKEYGTLLALIGFVMFLFPVGAMLLRLPYFARLNDDLPEARPVRGVGWWIAAALTALIPILTFFPLNNLINAEGYQASALFPQNLTTGIMYWALGNALITLVLFLAWHFLSNRNTGATARNYGLTWGKRLHWGRIGKSFLLAALIAFIGYLLLALMDFFFKIDFRFWMVGFKLMSPLQFRIFLGYLIPFTIFFLVLATALHGQLRLGDTVPLWKAMLVNVALLITGFILLMLVQYIPLFSGGTMTFNEPLLTIVAYQFIALLAIVALISTFFFRRTGHIYVGAFLCAILVTWYIVAGQATHYAF